MNLNTVIASRSDKTIYRDGDLAIKIFNETYSKSDILNEALNNARVEETGLNIPKIEEVAKIDNRWAIISTFIEGKTMAQLIEENPEKEQDYLKRFVDIQTEIHSKRSPLLNKLQDKMFRKIAETNLDETVKYDLQTRLQGMPKHVKVCHGDFNPSNIIIAKGDVPYILDWSHATQGNASADVARTYLLFRLAGKEKAAEYYIDLFCKKTNTEKKYIQSWMPIVAASQLVKSKAE